MKTTRLRIVVVLMVCANMAMESPPSRAGDLNAEVNAMFNNLGAIGNYTAPGAFRGQAFNTYSGGSLMMRASGRNYPLVSAQLPSCALIYSNLRASRCTDR